MPWGDMDRVAAMVSAEWLGLRELLRSENRLQWGRRDLC